ncbi:MAG: hypothetical protein CSA76_06000 [Spirochaetales bacterium]|nr:MAG: hypothetical protein CSA76_06000 [Spirochaetales bacterium]
MSDTSSFIVGHANMDLDCLGSMALASVLFPECRPVRSRLAHPAVREAITLYEDELPLLSLKDIKGIVPDRVVVVDTRSRGRIREFLDAAGGFPVSIEIYDHHSNEETDIPGARLVENFYGAQSSAMALMCRDNNLRVEQAIATLALAGIYADTGNFTHNSTTAHDFEAVSWLMQQGASLKMVRRLLRPLREPFQLDLFHRILGNLTWRRFHGHEVGLSRVSISHQTSGVAEVVDQVFSSEPLDGLLVLVDIEDKQHHLLIGRSRKDKFNLLDILAVFNGHGHVGAASALIKEGGDIWLQLLMQLETVPGDAVTASELMTKDVKTLQLNMPVMEASMFFEQTGFTGAPVVDKAGELVGMFSLKDVSKARKSSAMHAPVSAYMTRRIISCAPGDTIREMERLMMTHNVGHLPVMDGRRILGLITRGDYKKYYS